MAGGHHDPGDSPWSGDLTHGSGKCPVPYTPSGQSLLPLERDRVLFCGLGKTVNDNAGAGCAGPEGQCLWTWAGVWMPTSCWPVRSACLGLCPHPKCHRLFIQPPWKGSEFFSSELKIYGSTISLYACLFFAHTS